MRVLTESLAGIILAASVSAQAPPTRTGDEEAIRQVVQKYMDARNQQDSRAIEALFTEDADQLVSSGEWRKGRAEIVRGTMASSERTGGKRTIAVESVRFVAPTVAIVDGRYELAGLAGGARRVMWTTLVLTHGADGWRVAAIRNMLPASPPPQKTTIERIDIRGYRRTPEEVTRSCIKSEPGGIFDEARIQLDLRALYATGSFERIEVRESDGDIGKIVTFEVREKPLIRNIEFVGFKSFDVSAIEAYFKEHKVDMKVNSLYDPARLRLAEQAIERLLAQQGVRSGAVHSEIEKIPPESVRVRFILAEK